MFSGESDLCRSSAGVFYRSEIVEKKYGRFIDFFSGSNVGLCGVGIDGDRLEGFAERTTALPIMALRPRVMNYARMMVETRRRQPGNLLLYLMVG